MSRSDTEIVTDLLEATDAKDWSHVLELMAEDSFACNSTGKVYVGRAGFSNWLRDTAVDVKARWFETASVRQHSPGFVLVTGAEHRDPVRGASESIPGAWIYHVRDGQITATMYFRTEREALSSLVGPKRAELPADVIDRAFDAFNHDDYVGMISSLRDDVRFSSSILDPGVVRQGIAAFAHLAATLRQAFDDVLVEVSDIEELGDGFCIVNCRVRTRLDQVDSRRAVVWLARVVDGLVTEMVLQDTVEEARRAAAARMADHRDE
jgi:ketosteroid isomerase-like protein